MFHNKNVFDLLIEKKIVIRNSLVLRTRLIEFLSLETQEKVINF